MDSSVPVAEVVEPFGYAVPVGAEHLPSTLAFLEYVSSRQAQLTAAQVPMFQSIRYAPARSDVDSEQLSADQRNGFGGLRIVAITHGTHHSFTGPGGEQNLGDMRCQTDNAPRRLLETYLLAGVILHHNVGLCLNHEESDKQCRQRTQDKRQHGMGYR